MHCRTAKEVHFEIDADTGEIKAHVQGEPGRACLDVHRLVEERALHAGVSSPVYCRLQE